MKTAGLADWAGIAAFMLGVNGFVSSSLPVGLALIGAAALLLAYAAPHWRREALRTRRERRIAATRTNIHTLEKQLGFDPIHWDEPDL